MPQRAGIPFCTRSVPGSPSLVINALIENIDQVIGGKRAKIRIALC
ncbi:MAG: hypothetical protein ACJAR2_004265 [Ilumatobacter sp.]|jgi:hypothetical protein